MTELRVPFSDLQQPLDDRSREIFRLIVESYLDQGEPVGSRMLSKLLTTSLSPASVRNVMSDLEALGLIYSPHVSAGRMPTELGLRFFVDAFLETGDLGTSERAEIEEKVRLAGDGRPFDTVLTEASHLLSGLSRGAGIVLTGTADLRLKHIEFIRLEPTKALAVLVGDNDAVENRIFDLPAGTTASQLVEASNFLNAHVVGRTLREAQSRIAALKSETETALDLLSRQLVDQGLAVWRVGRSALAAHRARPGQSSGEPGGGRRCRAAAPSLRRSGDQERAHRASGPCREGQWRAHLHRLGKQALLPLRFVPGRRPLYGRRQRWRARADHRRGRRHRADAP